VLVAVGAAAVVEVARNGVVVVAVDGGDAALFDQTADLVRVRAVADQIPAAANGVHVGPLDRLQNRLQGGHVGVDVGDDGDPIHPAISRVPIDKFHFNRYT
jgi:hypothetical protein